MLNYKHLHYFWVVAKEGSITRAAERLGVAVQTISGQLGLLERQLVITSYSIHYTKLYETGTKVNDQFGRKLTAHFICDAESA